MEWWIESNDVMKVKFDHSEAKGMIGIQKELYGISIYVDGFDSSIAMIDLYYRSPVGLEDIPPGQRNTVRLVVENPVNMEPIAYVIFNPEEKTLRIELDDRWQKDGSTGRAFHLKLEE